MDIVISSELREILRVGVVRLNHINLPSDGGQGLWKQLCSQVNVLYEKYKDIAVSQIPGISPVRKLYRAVGLDPTKTRPSSEAMLRRAIKGKGLYKIHPLVDLFNLLSLQSLLPVGLYDETKISGTVIRVCIGNDGWGFDGIRKDRVNVAGRLCVADDLGPFGSPTSDSLRTSINGEVPAVLAIFFQHLEDNQEHLKETLNRAIQYGKDYLQGELVYKAIVG